jgi:hypothetical protein
VATFLLMRRLIHGLVGLCLLLTACGDDDTDDDLSAVTSVPDETTSTTTTTTEPRTVAPDVIPQDVSLITEDYVEQVLNELFGVALEALLAARSEGLVEERSLALIEATHSDDVFEQQVNDMISFARTGFEGVKDSPSPLAVTVVELLDVSRRCVVAEVTTDASGLMDEPPPPEPNERDFIRLLPASSEQVATGLNPTAWVLDQFPVTLDGSAADLGCDAT